MLIDLLREAVRTQPSKLALAFGAERFTYRDLLQLSGQLATGLASAGIAPGDRVVVLLPNCPELVVGVYAVTGIGAAAVLLDSQSRSQELALAARDCQPRAIITNATGLARWHGAGAGATELALVVGERLADSAGGGFWDFLDEHADRPEWDSDEDRVAVYQYSSGSTARAKRIGRTHAQWGFEVASLAAAVGHGPGDTVVCAIPLFHSYGCGSCLLTSARVGATLVLQERSQPFALRRLETLALVREWDATVLPAVPYMLDLLVSAPDRGPLPSVRYCGSSGAPLAETTFRAVDERFGIAVRQEYGSTESGKIAVNVDPDPRSTWASVGRALPGIDLAILGDDAERMPAGATGKIGIRSPGLTSDHSFAGPGDPRFLGDFFLTGDLGRLDDEGRLTVVGRSKLFIDVLGEKVDPTEVEEVLALHPAVRESVSLGVPGKRAGETVVKAVVVRAAPCDERELIRFCKERLASFKVPSVIEFREALPRSELGKVLRQDLSA